MAELMGKSTRGTAKGPSQNVTAMKTQDNSAQVAKDVVGGVSAAVKGQVQTDARQNALDVQGDQSLAEVNKVVIDQVDAQIAGKFDAPDVDAVNIMRNNNTISQREFEEARDSVFTDTIKTVQQVKQAISLNKMTKKEGDAMLNRFYRQNTSSVFGALFREDIAKGISSVTGNTGRSPTTDLEMSADDRKRKATEAAVAKMQANTAIQVETVMQAVPGTTQKAAEEIVAANQAEAYEIAQAKKQSASASLVSGKESSQMYNTAVGRLHRFADPQTGTITPQNIQIAANRLSFQHAEVMARTRTAGDDTTKLREQQTAEMASFNAIAKAMSDSEFQKNMATYNTNKASNYLWETNSQLAYLSEVMGPSFDIMNVDMNKIAHFSLLSNPALTESLGITLAPSFSRARNTFKGVKDDKTTNYTANQIVALASEMRKNRYNASVAMQGQEGADIYTGGQKEPVANRKGAAIVMAGNDGENLEQVYKKVVETNGQQYMNTLIDENYPVATSYIDRAAVKSAAPGAVDIAVNTVNVLASPDSRMMKTLHEVAPDAKISFVSKPNAIAATYGVDTPSRQLEIQNVPDDMVGSAQFKAVSTQIQDLYRALKNQPSLWAGTYNNIEDATEAIFSGAFIEPAVALKTATDLKNGTAEFQVIMQKGMPVVIRNSTIAEPDTTVPQADAGLPEGGTRGVGEVDVGRVTDEKADKGTRLNPDGTPAQDQALDQKDAEALQANFLEIINQDTTADPEKKVADLLTQMQEIRSRNRTLGEPARLDPARITEFMNRGKQVIPASFDEEQTLSDVLDSRLDDLKAQDVSGGGSGGNSANGGPNQTKEEGLAYVAKIQTRENNKGLPKAKGGWDKKNKTWSPHKSIEGGNKTVAYGHKMTDAEQKSGIVTINGEKVDVTKGISEQQAQELFFQDMEIHLEEAKTIDSFEGADVEKQKAILDLVYNFGLPKLKSSMPGTYEAIRTGDWDTAAEELKWKDPDDHSKGFTNYYEITSGGKKKTNPRARDNINALRGK